MPLTICAGERRTIALASEMSLTLAPASGASVRVTRRSSVAGDSSVTQTQIITTATRVANTKAASLTLEIEPLAGLVTVSDPVAVEPAINAATLAAICESYERNSRNNARFNAAVPSALITFGGTPAAGVVGYANTGVSTAGYTLTQIAATGSIVNGAPANNGAQIALPFRLYGAFPHSVAADGVQSASGYGRNGVRDSSATARFMFVTDEPKPIIELGGNSTKYVINVNDGTGWKRIFDSTLSGTDVTRYSVVHTAAGGYNMMQLDFSQVGGRMRRAIEIQQVSDHTIKRVGITAASTYYEPTESLRAMQLTDSLGNTSPDVLMSECYPEVMQDLFGIRDWFLCAEGGTGYLADASGTKRTHIQKLQNLLTIPQYANPHMLLIQASVNDASFTYAQKLAAMTDCLAFAASNWPGIPILALGPTAANTSASQTQSADTDAALAAAVAATGSPLVVHVPTMIGGMGRSITGTGTITTPNGSGNADFLFKAADGTHFAGAGHQLWGERMAGQIASRLRALLNSLV